MNQEREEREAALQESEEKYRTLFNIIDKGFCICQMLIDEHGAPYDYLFLEVNDRFEEHTGMSNPVGKTAREAVPQLEQYWVDIYGKVALSREPIRFEQYASGLGRWFDVDAFPFGDTESLRFCIVFNDISVRKNSEKHSQLLLSLTSALSNVLTEQELTNILIHEGLVGFGADGVTIARVTDDPSMLEVIGSHGYPNIVRERWATFPIDHPTLPISYAVRENTALWMPNPDARQHLLPMTKGLTVDEEHQSWAVLPFHVNNAIIGAIGLGFNTPTEFDIGERNFLLTLTEYYAQALHRAQLTQQLTLHAATQERQRLARDLHDSVKQLLFASSAIAQSLPRLWEKSGERAHEYTADVVNLNLAALAELQTLLLELRPESILKTSYMALLSNLCNGLRGHHAITIDIDYDGPDELYFPPDVHVSMYRLTQEILNNVNKHSHATKLTVHCEHDSQRFKITIADNGVGFDPSSTSRGFGLNTMHERAEAMGAHLTVASEAGTGTRITLEWHPNGSST